LIRSIAAKLGVGTAQTLRNRVRRAEDNFPIGHAAGLLP
jgi:hypothetical protein